MFWSRLRRAATSFCLSCFIFMGQAEAYEIPDGVDPATVLIGALVVDTFDGYWEPTQAGSTVYRSWQIA